MFGIGIQEMLILAVVGAMLIIPVVVVVIVLYVQASKRSHVPASVRQCADCGGMVSPQAPACPHCGRPNA